jgi:hypothetical protein
MLQQLWVKEGLSYTIDRYEWMNTEDHVWCDVPLQSPENESPLYWTRESPP